MSRTEYVQAPIDDEVIHQIIFKCFRLEGKPADLAQEVADTRLRLQEAAGVPIDICLINDGQVADVAGMEGLTVVGRQHRPRGEWCLGNMASATGGTP